MPAPRKRGRAALSVYPALGEVAALLACPECGLGLERADRALRCGRGHSFDIARQGYVGLLTGASTKMTGDTAEMLDARAAFQRAGHFAPIARAVVEAARDQGAVLEIGAGTGYYLGEVLAASPDALGIALDVAKPAVRRCARAHPRAAAVLADAWRGLPVGTGALDVVMAVFAPRNAAEIARVLRPDGRFVVVTPTSRHLAELVEPLRMVTVDPDKDRRVAETLAEAFTPCDRVAVEFPMSLSHADIAHVVGMGPSAFHDADRHVTDLPDTVEVTASVTVSTYTPR